MTWSPNGDFERADAQAKYGGTWRGVDGDLVYLTQGPMTEPRCTAARIIEVSGRRALLCGEGPQGCDFTLDWVVEVVDVGGGAARTESVARVLGGLGTDHGEGFVIPGPVVDSAPGISISYRFPANGGGPSHAIADEAAARIVRDLPEGPDTIDVFQDREARSPVVVRVGP